MKIYPDNKPEGPDAGRVRHDVDHRGQDAPTNQRAEDQSARTGKYDPHLPDEIRLTERMNDGDLLPETDEAREEAFRTTPGEELRPKDGTIGPADAR